MLFIALAVEISLTDWLKRIAVIFAKNTKLLQRRFDAGTSGVAVLTTRPHPPVRKHCYYHHHYYNYYNHYFWPGENPWWLKNYKRKLRNLFGSEPTLAGRHQQTLYCYYYYSYADQTMRSVVYILRFKIGLYNTRICNVFTLWLFGTVIIALRGVVCLRLHWFYHDYFNAVIQLPRCLSRRQCVLINLRYYLRFLHLRCQLVAGEIQLHKLCSSICICITKYHNTTYVNFV